MSDTAEFSSFICRAKATLCEEFTVDNLGWSKEDWQSATEEEREGALRDHLIEWFTEEVTLKWTGEDRWDDDDDDDDDSEE